MNKPENPPLSEGKVHRKFLEGCWTETNGVHLRIEEGPDQEIYIIFEKGPGGERIIEYRIEQFRRERLAKAMLAAREEGK